MPPYKLSVQHQSSYFSTSFQVYVWSASPRLPRPTATCSPVFAVFGTGANRSQFIEYTYYISLELTGKFLRSCDWFGKGRRKTYPLLKCVQVLFLPVSK